MPVPDPESIAAAIAGGGTVLEAVRRVVGPSVDEVGEMFRRVTAYRLRNIGRIADIADERSQANGTTGEVHPRVVHRLLEEGSYCDDEVMAQYLGGVLAASRTPDGRDDRAIGWSDLIASMSAMQVRAHYLIYRELADLLHGRTDLQVSMDVGRRQASLCVPTMSFLALLAQPGDEEFTDVVTALEHSPPGDLLAHAIPNLVRLGLIDDEFWYGSDPAGSPFGMPDYLPALFVKPTFAGMELYGWAMGLPGLAPAQFCHAAEPFELEPPLPRLGGAYLPRDPKRTISPPPPDGENA